MVQIEWIGGHWEEFEVKCIKLMLVKIKMGFELKFLCI